VNLVLQSGIGSMMLVFDSAEADRHQLIVFADSAFASNTLSFQSAVIQFAGDAAVNVQARG
jgi:hypothetical protein